MRKFLFQRLLAIVPLLFAVALGAFLLVKLAPGDFLSDWSQNPQISPEIIARERMRRGLDQPWHVQFLRWLGMIARGDFGYSFAYHRPASALLVERLWNTIVLAIGGLGTALAIAVPSAVYAARHRAGWFDRAAAVITAFYLSMPSFLLALLALVFAARTGWFPIGKSSSLDAGGFSFFEKLADGVHHLILPALVLAAGQAPAYFRQLRASLLEIITSDFILAARARGFGEKRIWISHALRNAINPTITMFGQSIGALLSGAFIVESIMSWPGLGSLAVRSLLERDLYVLVTCLLFAALLLMLGNLLADVLLLWSDPKSRDEGLGARGEKNRGARGEGREKQ